MVSYIHRLFKIEDGDSIIVFIPTLQKIYRLNRKMKEVLPNFVVTTESSSIKRPKSQIDYYFERVVLIVTNRCNLNCIYCYGDFNPKFQTRKTLVMPTSLALAAIDYTIKGVLESGKRHVRMGIVDGEPTLAWDTLVRAVDYFRFKTQEAKCHSTISLTTNGCIDNTKASWLARNVDSILISMDGFKSIHDNQRSGSFERVFATAKIIYGIAPKKLKLRATISAWSVDYLPKIVRFFGKNFPGCTQMYEPLFEIGREKENSCTESPLPDVFFDRFLKAIPIARQFNSAIRTSVLGIGRRSGLTFCGAAGRNFMVIYDGRVTACNRMVEEDVNRSTRWFCYGRFDSQSNKFIFDDSKYQRLKGLTVDNISDCQDCFARFSCKGDCPANKATIWPTTFWNKKSYRCEAIRRFTKDILSYILDHGPDGLVL